jgi:predicted anti-sigma-YlaC factor YlaD
MRLSILAYLVLLLALAGCSIKRLAIDSLGDAMADGSDVYAMDEDPDLIRDALPFALKTIEELLAESPENEKLLLAAASGFAGYAYLLQQEADILGDERLAEARRMRQRASRLFIRGRDYALRGLDLSYPGFLDELRQDPASTLALTGRKDAALLYWAGVSWAGAVSSDTSNLDLVADLPMAAALMRRVLDVDEGFDDGSAHDFFVAYEAGRPGGDVEAARRHFDRALELSGGKRAGLYVAWAESVAAPQQDLTLFRHLLDLALSIDAEREPTLRLVNVLAQRRARWLQTHIADIFILADQTG